MIPAALREFLHGLIDYAGLFPPAALPLGEAMANYRRYLAGPDAWMLSQFVIPAARLGELPDGGPPDVALSVLPGGGADSAAFLGQLASDLAACGESQVAAFEAKLPVSASQAAALARGTRARIDEAGLADAMIFFEAPADDQLPAVIAALAEANVHGLGFKLRCGGLKADQFPSPRQIATALHHCAAHGLPMKFTAGLHHPLHHYDAAIGTPMHGFLNIFAAAMLARHEGLDIEALIPLVECEDVASVTFDDESMIFLGHRLTTSEIGDLRRHFAFSYGCCSFDDPRDDLRALGLLPPITSVTENSG